MPARRLQEPEHAVDGHPTGVVTVHSISVLNMVPAATYMVLRSSDPPPTPSMMHATLTCSASHNERGIRYAAVCVVLVSISHKHCIRQRSWLPTRMAALQAQEVHITHQTIIGTQHKCPQPWIPAHHCCRQPQHWYGSEGLHHTCLPRGPFAGKPSRSQEPSPALLTSDCSGDAHQHHGHPEQPAQRAKKSQVMHGGN